MPPLVDQLQIDTAQIIQHPKPHGLQQPRPRCGLAWWLSTCQSSSDGMACHQQCLHMQNYQLMQASLKQKLQKSGRACPCVPNVITWPTVSNVVWRPLGKRQAVVPHRDRIVLTAVLVCSAAAMWGCSGVVCLSLFVSLLLAKALCAGQGPANGKERSTSWLSPFRLSASTSPASGLGPRCLSSLDAKLDEINTQLGGMLEIKPIEPRT